MKPYHDPGSQGNWKGVPHASLPLFAWAATRITPDPLAATLPRAARIIARRCALSQLRARVIAELAGFNLEVSE